MYEEKFDESLLEVMDLATRDALSNGSNQISVKNVLLAINRKLEQASLATEDQRDLIKGAKAILRAYKDEGTTT